MVYLILTRHAFDQLPRTNGLPPSPLWLNAGVLPVEEIEELRRHGLDISSFSRPINLDDLAAIQAASATVRQHHPNDVVWIEYSVDFGVNT
jgi:hypothetical protein